MDERWKGVEPGNPWTDARRETLADMIARLEGTGTYSSLGNLVYGDGHFARSICEQFNVGSIKDAKLLLERPTIEDERRRNNREYLTAGVLNVDRLVLSDKPQGYPQPIQSIQTTRPKKNYHHEQRMAAAKLLLCDLSDKISASVESGNLEDARYIAQQGVWQYLKAQAGED